MKAFILFMFYTAILFLIACTAATISIIAAWTIHPMIIGILVFCGFVAALSVGGVGCAFLPQLCMNRTTLERIAGLDPNQFDGGSQRNLREVCGPNCLTWFIPTKPAVSGFLWSGIDLDAVIGDARGP
jgi:hypothetical protein